MLPECLPSASLEACPCVGALCYVSHYFDCTLIDCCCYCCCYCCYCCHCCCCLLLLLSIVVLIVPTTVLPHYMLIPRTNPGSRSWGYRVRDTFLSQVYFKLFLPELGQGLCGPCCRVLLWTGGVSGTPTILMIHTVSDCGGGINRGVRVGNCRKQYAVTRRRG